MAGLQNGKVLVAGGLDFEAANELPLSSAELYDPQNGTFSLTGSMVDAREFATGTTLTDGRVLVAGGCGHSSAELYNP
jgi:hypothetical protein